MALLRTLLLLAGMASFAHAADLTTLDGKKSTGDIVSIDDKQVVFKAKGGNETFELTKLSAIDISARSSDTPIGTKCLEVELVDGSQFRCAEFKIKNKTAILTLLSPKITVELPASLLLYMVRDLSDPKINQTFRGILSKRGKRDIWIIQKGEALDGVNGTFGDGDAKGETINFEFEATGEKQNIQMKRIYGMIFNPPPIVVAATVCRVTDGGKNVLYAKSLTVTEKNGLTVETITGLKVEYPSIDSVAKLDFSAGSMLYLSNLDPIKVEQSSTEGVPEPYRRDRNLDNDELSINRTKYPKGISLHSRTVLTYDLGGKFNQFQAIAGVDDCVEGGESKATLTIEADFKPIFKEVIKKGEMPKSLNLTVLNVKQLRITVYSEFLDLGNQVDLVDAKLLK